jgi:DNA-binding transcriptional ArsR family regulator
MNQATTDRTLFALFCLSRDTRHIDASEIARAAGLSPTAAAEALVVLERAGLVDATRARLTMLGLARAAKLSGAGGGRPSVDLRHAKPRRARPAAIAAAPAAGCEETETPEVDPNDRVEQVYPEERCTIQ